MMSRIKTDEVWKEIEDYPSYMVSNQGRVKNCKRNKYLRGSKDSCGYVQVGLTDHKARVFFSLHRLVAIYHIPNPLNLPEVNHLDKVRHHDYASNLEWTTTQENVEYSLAESYVFLSPDGVETEVFNLTKFSRDNGLDQGSMVKVSQGHRQYHKGWSRIA